jgi:hypothetical protein
MRIGEESLSPATIMTRAATLTSIDAFMVTLLFGIFDKGSLFFMA